MLIVGWGVFGIATATLVVLASVVNQYMHLWRQLYWILAVIIIISGWFAIVGTVGFIRALSIPPKARAQQQPAAQASA